MRPRIDSAIRDSPVTRRFRKHRRRKSRDQESEDNGDAGDVDSTHPLQSQEDTDHDVEGESNSGGQRNGASSHAPSHAPPPPPLPPQQLDMTNNNATQQLTQYTSIGDAGSTGKPLPSNGGNLSNSPSSNHQRIPSPTPSTSIRSMQQRPRAGSRSSAQETSKDKIDDDAYSAWWFLASISESFDSIQTNGSAKSIPVRKYQAGTGTDATKMKTDPGVGPSAPADVPNADVDNYYELPTLRHSGSLPSRQLVAKQTQHYHQQSQAKPLGGKYTLKEQKNRDDWLAKDALGGTLNYDQNVSGTSLTSPYYRLTENGTIPPKKRPSPHNLLKVTKSEDHVEWTPQDSSYGAAFGCAGWVPKRIRKLFEVIFVVLIMALLIFVVVKTGIKLKSSGSGGGEDIILDDDDHYLAFNDDGGGSDHSGSGDSQDGSGSQDGSNDGDH